MSPEPIHSLYCSTTAHTSLARPTSGPTGYLSMVDLSLDNLLLMIETQLERHPRLSFHLSIISEEVKDITNLLDEFLCRVEIFLDV